MLLAVLSDTHGLLRPELLPALRAHSPDHILHAGDVGNPDILTTLSTVAPTIAIRGNIDRHGPCADLPATEVLDLNGTLLYMLHDLATLDIHPHAAGISVILSGHSHRPAIDHRDSVLYLNPGSVGPRRFNLPITYALLELTTTGPTATIIPLDIQP